MADDAKPVSLFGDAEIPESTKGDKESKGDKPKDKAKDDSPIQSSGVPAHKLAAVGLPIAAVVAFPLMLAVSPLLAVGVLGAGLTGGAVVAVGHHLAKRRAALLQQPTSGKGGKAVPQAKEPRGRRWERQPRQPRQPRSWGFPGRPGKGGGNPGGGRGGGRMPWNRGGGSPSRGANAGRPGMGNNDDRSPRRSMRDRMSGRNRPGATPKPPGHAPRGSSRDVAGGGRPGTGRGTGRTPGGNSAGQGRSRNPFKRNNGDRSPAGGKPSGRGRGNGGGAAGGSAGSRGQGPRRYRELVCGPGRGSADKGRRKKKDSPTDPAKQSRRQWWFGPNKPGEPEKAASKDGQGKGSPTPANGTQPVTPAAASKPKKPGMVSRAAQKLRPKKASLAHPNDGGWGFLGGGGAPAPAPAVATQKGNAAAPTKPTAAPKAPKPVAAKGHPDDGGWGFLDQSTPAAKPAKAPKVVAPKPQSVGHPDDGGWGFLSHSASQPQSAAPSRNEGNNTMATDDLVRYAAMIDPSTPAQLASSLGTVATHARVDAAQYDTKANNLRTSAAGLANKPGMQGAAAVLLAQAAKAAETADNRRAYAASCDSAAAAEGAKATA